MANTTFNGPVRSENGFQDVTKNAVTGAVTLDADFAFNTEIGGKLVVEKGSRILSPSDAGSNGPSGLIVGKGTYTSVGDVSLVANPYSVGLTQLYPLGTKLIDGERTYRYSRANAVAIAAGKLLQSAVSTTTHQGLAPAAAPIGATSVTLTLGSTNATKKDEYKDGYLMVSAGTSIGSVYKISGNAAANAGGTCAVTIYEPLLVALVNANSKMDLTPNPYGSLDTDSDGGVLITPTTLTSGCIGYSHVAVAAKSFFWAQTAGPASILTSGTVVIGNVVVASTATAGAVMPSVDNATALVSVGTCMTARSAGNGAAVFLNID